MGLTEISVRRPVIAWILMGALLLFGWMAQREMGVGALPDVDLPVVSIGLHLPGASPEVMELEVVDPIEEALASVSGIKSITSSSSNGSANIAVELNLNRKIDSALAEVNGTLSRILPNLPKDLDPPSVSKTNPEDQPIVWIMVSSEGLSEPELMGVVRDEVKERLSKVPGVGQIIYSGYAEPALRVRVKRAALAGAQLSITDVVSTIRTEHAELPGGQLRTAERSRVLRSRGEASDLVEFGELSVMKRGGEANYAPIALSRVALVEEGLEDAGYIARASGRPAVGLGVKKQAGFNAVAVADAVRSRLDRLQGELPKGVTARMTVDLTRFVRESIHELSWTLVFAAILTSFICWLFLGSWSATLNVIVAIPTSILGALIVLRLLGYTLNTFTLLALSLAIGIVVDDAIMVLENIVRHFRPGTDRRAAALDGTREITFAAIAATAALVAVFLPVVFMKGIVGSYLMHFGVTLTVAVLLSLLEALTLTPMRCSKTLGAGGGGSRFSAWTERAFDRLTEAYRSALARALRHRWTTCGGAVLVSVALGSFGLRLRQEIVPPQDQDFLAINLRAPTGASLAFTDLRTRQVEAYIAKRPEVRNYETFIGDFDSGGSNVAATFVTLKPPSERPRDPEKGRALSQQELMDVYRKGLEGVKDLEVTLQDLSQAGLSGMSRGFPVELSVRGKDWDGVVAASARVQDAMRATGLMVDVSSNHQAALPQIEIVADRERARRRGVSVAEITQTVSALVGGTLAGKYTKFGHRWNIRVSALAEEVASADAVLAFPVRNHRNELIPLREVVNVRERPSVQAISRIDRERAISVYANLAAGVSQAHALAEVERIGRGLPVGFSLSVEGNAQAMEESFRGFLLALLLGVVIAYMVLAVQFDDFLDPFAVLLALPFSLSGAFLALWLGGKSLNMYSLIGLVLLMGIVKKNSILIIDFTKQLRAEGRDPCSALLEACPVRLRPILMTSVATVAGAIPAAAAIGPGSETRVPMALAVIGGIVVSTVFTLFVVPCFYSLVNADRRIIRLTSNEPFPVPV